MSKYFYIILLLTLFTEAGLQAQPQRFIVKPAPFSSRINDEFSPELYFVRTRMTIPWLVIRIIKAGFSKYFL